MGGKEGKGFYTLLTGSFSSRVSGKMALSGDRELPKKRCRLQAKTKR